MFKKFKYYIFGVVIVLVLVSIGLIVLNMQQGPSVSKIFQVYKEDWEKQDFKAMYSMLSSKSKESITEKHFVERHANIYKSLGVHNISLILNNADVLKKSKENSIIALFAITMDTSVSKLQLHNYEMTMEKEKINGKKEWRIAWTEALIFPEMVQGDRVKIETLHPKRGEIYDKNGKGLAINGFITTIGLHPRNFLKNKKENIAELSKILDIKPAIILRKLNASHNPDYFVPIVNISTTQTDKILGAMKITGVLQQKSEGRVYPGGEAFGSLIGYVGAITAQELSKNASKGYNSSSVIGKAGLEQVYEDKLKGVDGKIIYISKITDGKEVAKIVIAKKDVINGENIKTSIDMELQNKIYSEMNKNAGASAAINPITGEVLALVSSPSYDSNLYTTYIPDSIRDEWSKSDKKPYENRFKKTYAPGSTFKMITSAIGLKQGKIKPAERVNIKGTEWQLNKSWGNYKITRVKDNEKPEDLTDAFVYSDNIYFAMASLRIGIDAFIKGCNDFGVGEALPLEYPIGNSQVANLNNINSTILLADSGYGQGQVLMSPLQIAMTYSSLVNKGNIMVPILSNASGQTVPKVWKGKLISPDNIKIILNCLTAVIENPEGTGHAAMINGTPLAGKTGTAELKKNAGDITAEENGWFTCMNTDNPKIVISMLIEDVKNRGESHFVVPIVRNVMEYYLSRQ
jgi:cell division protein FtsI/penicillin-binding protein 2